MLYFFDTTLKFQNNFAAEEFSLPITSEKSTAFMTLRQTMKQLLAYRIKNKMLRAPPCFLVGVSTLRSGPGS